ncbi:Cysteine-rich membrane protein 2 [Spironucleus salmonicida]|uniref:Cysteine-rich membrane protein 2 n=1 Tax=Spironucleus salmonicida TaxID=348837 RepID=A0A9P8LR69_9EUKA|nr:Cysteine-rich membrane protein 2 [Spironucleus salmonicida]
MIVVVKCTESKNTCPVDKFCPAPAEEEMECLDCTDDKIESTQGCNCVEKVAIKRCKECNEGQCTKCFDKSFMKADGSCEDCSFNCATCETTQDNCTSCKAGFILDMQTKMCERTCKSHKECTSKNSGYCDFSVGQCKACSDGCRSCASKTFCAQCNDSEGKPVLTIDGTCTAACAGIQDGNYCKNGTATKCEGSITSECKCGEKKSCATCNTDSSACETCLPNITKTADGDCSDCAEGYESVGLLCISTSTLESNGTNLGGGAVAGIIVGVLVVLGAVGGGLTYYFIKKSKTQKFQAGMEESTSKQAPE